MKMRLSYIAIASSLLLISAKSKAQEDSLLFSMAVPDVENGAIFQKINYQCNTSSKANLELECYQLGQSDSIRLYDLVFDNIDLKGGVHSLMLNYEKPVTRKYQDADFLHALKKSELYPPGVYAVSLTVKFGKDSLVSKRRFLWNVDSTLAYNSGLRNSINNTLAPRSAKIRIHSKTSRKAGKNATAVSEDELKNVSSRLSKKIGRRKGIQSVPEIQNGKTYTALYYKQWFLGRYEIRTGAEMKEKIEQERDALKSRGSPFITTDLFNFSSISSQVKKTHKKDKCDQETKLNIDLTSAFGNGQEAGSKQDNIYQEVRGAIETNILNIPVTIEGYYTTQDSRRIAKASYIKFHYDVEESKNQLLNKISAFKEKYNETKSSQPENPWQLAINALANENNVIASGFKRNYHLDIHSIGNGDHLSNLIEVDTADLINAAKNKGASNENAQKASEKKAEAQRKYNKYKANQEKIAKYTLLLRQYKDQMYFDSVLTYKNLEKLKEGDSYKRLIKGSSNLLPRNKGSKVLAGITNFDAGIFNKYESDYTISGQNIKGANLGYDFGFIKTSFAAGKTEYISRSGQVDVYNTYMVRADSRIAKNQSVGLIYYGYMPTRKIIVSDKFKSDLAIPTFLSPTHIVSLVYTGNIAPNLIASAEAASSFKKSQPDAKPCMDNSAIKTSLSYDIPVINTTVEGEWEHMGRTFENSALPIIKNATECYTIAGKTAILRSHISVGLQYNFLKQSTFATTGYNTKWGFDLNTRFKQYPNLFVSYKPFSTFRAYNDTLTIPQRPLFGEVLIARGSYQFKVQKITHRFMVIYNTNHTSSDSFNYRTKSVQAGYIYTTAGDMLSANAGWLSQSPGVDSTVIGNSWFINVMASHMLNRQFSVNLGQDVTWTSRAIEKLSTTAGMSYAFAKLPLVWNLQLRYTHFTSNLYSDQPNLVAGLLGLNWQFKLRNKCSTM